MPSNADAKLRVASKTCCVSAQCFVRPSAYFSRVWPHALPAQEPNTHGYALCQPNHARGMGNADECAGEDEPRPSVWHTHRDIAKVVCVRHHNLAHFATRSQRSRSL